MHVNEKNGRAGTSVPPGHCHITEKRWGCGAFYLRLPQHCCRLLSQLQELSELLGGKN